MAFPWTTQVLGVRLNNSHGFTGTSQMGAEAHAVYLRGKTLHSITAAA